MMRDPKIRTVSIIIPTFNRADAISKVLASLSHLSAGLPFEVIVINGPSTDETAAFLQQNYADKIKILNCPVANVSMSRNIGVAAAAGDVIAFIDDDAIPVHKDWLQNLVKFLTIDATTGAVGGFVIDGNSNEYVLRYCAATVYALLGQAHHLEDESALPREYYLYVNGCNAAMPTQLLKAIGGFDEYYAYYLEEPDICIRLSRLGFKTQIDPNPAAAIRHFPNPSGRHSWDVMVRSDAYFCIKNAGDPIETRIDKTRALNPEKHYLQYPRRAYENGGMSQDEWDKLSVAMKRGLDQGIEDGLHKARSLKKFPEPPDFKIFPVCAPQKKLRVALLSKTLPFQTASDSIGHYMYDLAQGLHELGHEVHVLYQGNEDRYEFLDFTLHGVNSKVDVLHSNLTQRRIAYSDAIVLKLGQLEQIYGRFDIVHATHLDAEAWGVITAHQFPVLLMLVSSLTQTAQAEQWDINDDLATCMQIEKWQVMRADGVCVASIPLLAYYETLLGVKTEAWGLMQPINLGVVPSIQTALLKPQNIRRRLLFVGQLTRSTGAHRLLEILPDLLTQFIDWECHFVGDDRVVDIAGQPLRVLVTEQWKHTDWYARVYFHHAINTRKLEHQYQNCDLFVLPSSCEALGVAFYRAMQYAKAVVGCDTSIMRDLVENGQEGILVTPDTPQELLKGLASLMKDEDLRIKLGQAGYRRVCTQNHYKKMALEVEKRFFEILEK